MTSSVSRSEKLEDSASVVLVPAARFWAAKGTWICGAAFGRWMRSARFNTCDGPLLKLAVIGTEKNPATEGVPEMTPVTLLKVRPAGKDPTLQEVRAAWLIVFN